MEEDKVKRRNILDVFVGIRNGLSKLKGSTDKVLAETQLLFELFDTRGWGICFNTTKENFYSANLWIGRGRGELRFYADGILEKTLALSEYRPAYRHRFAGTSDRKIFLTAKDPEEIRMIYLNHNQLQGTIPEELWDAVNLTHLIMEVNSLTGTLSKRVGGLNKLSGFSLRSNNLTGVIPVEIGGLVSITGGISLNNNSFSGKIPQTLNNVVNMASLWLNDNELDDYEEGTLNTQAKLASLRIHNNSLSAAHIDAILKDLYESLSLDDRVKCAVQLNGNEAPTGDPEDPDTNTGFWYREQLLDAGWEQVDVDGMPEPAEE